MSYRPNAPDTHWIVRLSAVIGLIAIYGAIVFMVMMGSIFWIEKFVDFWNEITPIM